MKIEVENLGALHKADFELGDMTIICGKNNTGKTYATYATYGFFDYLSKGYEIEVSNKDISTLLKKGILTIDLNKYAKNIQEYLNSASKEYLKILPDIFAGKERAFIKSSFKITVEESLRNFKEKEYKAIFGSAEKKVLKFDKKSKTDKLTIYLIAEVNSDDIPHHRLIKSMIGDTLKEIILMSVIPKAFIASAERTGSVIFQKELDFTRNSLLDIISDRDSKLTPIKLLGKFSGEYPIPVKRNVDFIRNIPSIKNKESFIFKEHPEILSAFEDIIDGKYKVMGYGEIVYIPNSNKKLRLSLAESSSSVRAMLDIGFYLQCIAQKGDILMIDEPELNLHPENQRLVARLFARLVNIGIKVFITTHSDYIVKEINTLIMLDDTKPELKRIMKKEKYCKEELLKSSQIRAYVAEYDKILLPGNKRKTKSLTFTPADIDPELGIELKSFDSTINEMARIQEDIFFSGDGED